MSSGPLLSYNTAGNWNGLNCKTHVNRLIHLSSSYTNNILPLRRKHHEQLNLPPVSCGARCCLSNHLRARVHAYRRKMQSLPPG
ncbi:hypothetical protein V1264_015100 [Littorina saxatilis]|uniref:Uncharacterized protein n=1 Tax=Littorina saxatilis TaxID=31220 RepID=A0AAN9GFJ8_9CAEN